MNRKKLGISIGLFMAFTLWTAAVCLVDVKAIGPQNTSVGFACINGFLHRLTGVNFLLYHITDWLGLVPVGVCMGFAVLGLAQWIKRKRICKVDFSILALGGFYIITIVAYLFFEEVVINYRPVLISGILEASYPSSTTMLTLCVMPTAAMQFNTRIKNRIFRKCTILGIMAFTAFMVIGRFLSGVHWFTDIFGGMLLSAALVVMYGFISELKENFK